MNTKLKYLYLAVFTAFFVSCASPPKDTNPGTGDMSDMKHVTLDTMKVLAVRPDVEKEMIPEYKPSKERVWDLLHTILDLSFDWKNESVSGKATLSLKPVFYTQQSLRLDAVGFDIKQILVDGQNMSSYQNTGEAIIIQLNKAYTQNETLGVVIHYTAHPSATQINPGMAIGSDKGLFFIDPQDTIPGLPRQIWTQGETTNNRRWFPTLDQPNERATQEIYLTVPDTLMTLSNGLLISSKTLAGGMRQDYWKLDLPHAPYLTMIAVGQWDKETDYWRGRPVEYYVDPGYGPSARAIFQHTPEMIEFFSKKLGYDFVWPKYAQIIVKNFVSGAMENTTAVVFGDFVQFDKDDIVEDGSNDDIVAHELFHHWFGDLVTCESWANLTLNEGFANYAEYLWKEYKYGRERADISRLNELSNYYDQAMYDAHPLIHYHYGDENQMFDAHSYNKGGLVLHMLRDLVGDDAFFASLRAYLKQHAFASAEVHDLRLAFEATTGKDLHWFFDQWYFGKGHPVLGIRNSYDATSKNLTIDFSQSQDTLGFHPVFTLPIEIAIFHSADSVEYQHVTLNQKKQIFSFSVANPPQAVVIDPRDILLAVIHHDIPPLEYPIRALSGLSINHRISALRLMEEIEPDDLTKLIADTSFMMRIMMISLLDDQRDINHLLAISKMEHREIILFFILETLLDLDPSQTKEIALRLLEFSSKPPIVAGALLALADVDLDEAIHQLAHVKNDAAPAIFIAKASIYARKGNQVSLEFFTTPFAATIREEYLEHFIKAMALFLSKETPDIQDQGLAYINSDFYLKTPDPQYRRYYLITGLLEQYSNEMDRSYQNKILNTIRSLYKKETNEYLKGVLKDGLGELLD